MNVDVLINHLSSLSHLLRNAGASRQADELAKACQELQPYRAEKLGALLAKIAKAEEVLKKPPKAPKASAPDQVTAARITERIAALYARAGQPSFPYGELDETIADPQFAAFSLPQLKQVAARLGIKVSKKDTAIDMIKRAIADRAGSLERSHI